MGVLLQCRCCRELNLELLQGGCTADASDSAALSMVPDQGCEGCPAHVKAVELLTAARQLLTGKGQVLANISRKLLEHLLRWELITSPTLRPKGANAFITAGEHCHELILNDQSDMMRPSTMSRTGLATGIHFAGVKTRPACAFWAESAA